MDRIFSSYGSRPAEMTAELMEQAEVGRELRLDMKVVVKPNLILARPAEEGATTHPGVVEGILIYLRDHGVRDITIAEGSWVGDRTERAWERCGYRDLERRYGVALLDTKGDPAVPVEGAGIPLEVCRSILQADYLINVPVLKGHCQTGMTCCLKNMKGCIPDREKRRYHTMGLDKPIAALNAVLRPQLHIVDNLCGDLDFEEGGTPVQTNRILLGRDGVFMDAYCAALMGFRPEEIGYLARAQEFGLGSLDREPQVVELHVENKPALEPNANGKAVRGLARSIAEDGACSACYASLIRALTRASCSPAPGSLKIGQGFRGKNQDGVGVGNCAAGCPAHIGGCPPRAVDIVDFLERTLR